MLDIIIFNVQLGQCIFFYPRNNPEYGLMVDCGNTPNFDPIDRIIEWNLLPIETSGQKKIYKLRDFTLTNYDQDHFSGLPYLISKVKIETVRLPKNLSAEEILKLKEEITEPIEDIVHIIKTYTHDAENYSPPYTKRTYYLKKSDFPSEKIDTNKLSQIVFVDYKNFRICIPGDLTSPAWEKLLLNEDIKTLLKKTHVFIASHHGREDGFNEKIFEYCKPECIILSDKDIVHKTQEGMTSVYLSRVKGGGIILNGDTKNPRKTLTTRSDGHIWIRINDDSSRIYRTVQ
jgi:hypothetical protein